MQSPIFPPVSSSRKTYKPKIRLLSLQVTFFQLHKWTWGPTDRGTAIAIHQSQHSISAVLHGATGCGFWDREGFHESSRAVTPGCGYTNEWRSAFGPHWFLMNHRCCFDFLTSQVWALDSPFSVEGIFVLQKSQRLGWAGTGAGSFWGNSPQGGLLHQHVVSPCTRLFWGHMG